MIARTYRSMSSSRSMPDARTNPGRTSRPRWALASSTDGAAACRRAAWRAARSRRPRHARRRRARDQRSASRPGASRRHGGPQFVELGSCPRQRPWCRITSSIAAAMQSSTAPVSVAGNAAFAALGYEPLDRRPSGAAVSSSSRRTPPCITRRWSSGVGDHAQRHALADVEQRRVRPHAERPVARSRRPAAGRRRPSRRCPRRSSIGAAAAIDERTDPASLRLDRGEVGADGMHLAVVVRHDDVEHGGDRAAPTESKSRGRTGDARDRRQRRRPARRPTAFTGSVVPGRRTTNVAASVSASGISDRRIVLGQRPHERRRRARARWPGHVPVEAVVGDLVERRQRDVHRHAVERLRRREAVRQRQLDVALAPRVGEVGEAEAVEVQRVGDDSSVRSSGSARSATSFHQRSKCRLDVTSAATRSS